MAENLTCDVVIAGCGVAGLYAALKMPRATNIIMLSKGAVDECDSMLAQGGICVLAEDDDYDAYFEDTMIAGHNENRAESVDIMIRGSRAVVSDLIGYGVRFERDDEGHLAFTREGAHSRPRICFHADETGKEITTALLAAVRKMPNVRILEHVEMRDLVLEAVPLSVEEMAAERSGEEFPKLTGVTCAGVEARTAEGEVFTISAHDTIMATGGVGGSYERSTNFPLLTGDACRIAQNHGIACEHLDYVQIHPTSLYTTEPGRAFLISESCRGEGAVLLDAEGKRFCNELDPRDVVTQAILDKMAEEGSDYVRLSFELVNPDIIKTHFRNIYEHCLEAGYDITTDPIPVVPAQHYFMGGVHVDKDSQTTCPHLFAVGETSCNGVHGKNRLASNSLLEALVFARRAAYRIAAGRSLPVVMMPQATFERIVRKSAPAQPKKRPVPEPENLLGTLDPESIKPAGTFVSTDPAPELTDEEAVSAALASLDAPVVVPGEDLPEVTVDGEEMVDGAVEVVAEEAAVAAEGDGPEVEAAPVEAAEKGAVPAGEGEAAGDADDVSEDPEPVESSEAADSASDEETDAAANAESDANVAREQSADESDGDCEPEAKAAEVEAAETEDAAEAGAEAADAAADDEDIADEAVEDATASDDAPGEAASEDAPADEAPAAEPHEKKE